MIKNIIKKYDDDDNRNDNDDNDNDNDNNNYENDEGWTGQCTVHSDGAGKCSLSRGGTTNKVS